MNHRHVISERRGGALVALGSVLAGWLVLRLALWEAPFLPSSLTDRAVAPLAEQTVADVRSDDDRLPSPSENADPLNVPLPPWSAPPPLAPVQKPPERPLPPIISELSRPMPAGRSPMARRGFAAIDRLVNHAAMLRSGYGLRTVPQASSTALHAVSADTEKLSPSRWSVDAWALWRNGEASPLLSGRPSYGRSQIGAVMRYSLAPSSAFAPQVHLRGTSALEGAREREVALGVSARPIPAIPVRLAAEARLSETAGGTEPRAAVYAVTEFAPMRLPYGMSGETYVQAGYVTGDFSSAFVDGQARITRPVAGADDFRLEAGVGAWGGAQEDAARLDVGPTAALTFRIGPARGRVSADYRFRVAGDAEPASGPALTVTAGF